MFDLTTPSRGIKNILKNINDYCLTFKIITVSK